MKTLDNNPHWQILLKEIDLIHGNRKKSGDIIYKTKNFATIFWGGSLYLIVEHLKSVQNVKSMILFTAIIPTNESLKIKRNEGVMRLAQLRIKSLMSGILETGKFLKNSYCS